MLEVYFLALCLATTGVSTINERHAGYAYPDHDGHPASRHSQEFSDGRGFLGSRTRESQNTPTYIECRDRTSSKTTNERCEDTFLTNLEASGPLGPGFPLKPVGYRVRPNISTEQLPTIPNPEGRFLLDDMLPMSPSPLRLRPSQKEPVNNRERLKSPVERLIGPGFPPKPVGYLVKPNVSREQETSTPRKEDQFLIDDRPPLPSVSLRHGSLTKGRALRPNNNGGKMQRLVEGELLGPGFPPKPVGYLVNPNISRGLLSSTPSPESRFLVDDIPLLPSPTLRKRPLTKQPLKKVTFHNSERQRLTEQGTRPKMLSRPFYKSQESKEHSSGYNEDSVEQKKPYLDNFNELDHPDSNLPRVKERPHLEHSHEEESSGSKEVERQRISYYHNEEENLSNVNSKEIVSSLEHPKKEEAKRSEHSVEDEESDSEEEEAGPVLESDEGRSTTENSEYDERPNTVYTTGKKRPNGKMSEEDEELSSETISDEERPDPENSEEDQIPPAKHSEEQGTPVTIHSTEEVSLHSNASHNVGKNTGSISSEERPAAQYYLDDSGINLSHSEEEENLKTTHSTEDSVEETQHSEEESDSKEKPYSNDSEETNGANSSEVSGEESYQPQSEEEGSNDESMEVAQKPVSSSENVSEGPTNPTVSEEEPHPEYYESLDEQPPLYLEPPTEYEDNQRQPYYYDLPNYGDFSPESEYEDNYPRPWQPQDQRPQLFYYTKRPQEYYYVFGEPTGQKKVPNSIHDYSDTTSKGPNFEDNKLKQSEEVDSSISTAEEQSSSNSEENINSGSHSSEVDPVPMKTPQNENGASKEPMKKTPVAVLSNETPQSTTKCANNVETISTATPIDLKRLKKPLGIATTKPPQLGDVVNFTRARPALVRWTPATRLTTSTIRPATIAALGIVKPGGSIIKKVVSPLLKVLSSTSASTTNTNNAQVDLPARPSQSPWRNVLAAMEATALTYLKPPAVSHAQTWLLRKRRGA